MAALGTLKVCLHYCW